MKETVIVIGAGAADGVGAAVSRQFAQQGFHVVIAGRTEDKVKALADMIKADGGSAEGVRADVTSPTDQDALFAQAASSGPIAAVIYNAGNNHPIAFEDLDDETFESFWRVGCFGGYLAAKRAMPILAAQGHGSMFFTGASASMRGKPGFAHFSSMKAGLRMLAQSLAREYGPQGVHVAHVVLDGVVNGESVRGRFAGYIEALGEDGSLSPQAIAEAFYYLHTQPKAVWTHELDLRPHKENW